MQIYMGERDTIVKGTPFVWQQLTQFILVIKTEKSGGL